MPINTNTNESATEHLDSMALATHIETNEVSIKDI